MSLLIRDESTGELEHREVMGRESLPAHEQPPEAVVPTVGALDDPAPGDHPHAAQEGRLATASDVRDDPPMAHGGFRVGVVVALVQAQMRRPSRAPRGVEYDRVKHVGCGIGSWGAPGGAVSENGTLRQAGRRPPRGACRRSGLMLTTLERANVDYAPLLQSFLHATASSLYSAVGSNH